MSGNTPTLTSYEESIAPWNDTPMQEQKEFFCEVTETLTKQMNIPTGQYEVLVERQDDGGIYEIDTCNVQWEDEYKENCYTIKDLLILLESYLKADLMRHKGSPTKEREITGIINACRGWKVHEINVEEI